MGIRTEDRISCGQCVEACEFGALYFVSTHGYAQVKFDPKKCVPGLSMGRTEVSPENRRSGGDKLLELNQFYNMDCMEGMKQFPDKYFELAIVDPPYGIGAGKGTRVINKNETWKNAKDNNKVIKGEWDNKIPDKEYFEELFRVSKNQIIWGGNYFSLPSNNNWIIWDKKITNHTFSPFEMAWSSNGKCKIFRWMLEGYKSENPKEMQNRFHPTQKPVALYRWLLQNYAKPGDKILDTHVGSGSSLIACWEEGFEYCGFEIDEDYHKMATERLEAVKAQTRLF